MKTKTEKEKIRKLKQDNVWLEKTVKRLFRIFREETIRKKAVSGRKNRSGN